MFNKDIFLPLFVLFLGVTIVIFCSKSVVTKHTTTYLYPPEFIVNNTFGYSNLVADSFWLRVIQDFDYCENAEAPKAVNSGANLDDIINLKIKASRCNKGWVFQMIDVITDIDPKFEYPYYAGALNLNVAVDDREGAGIIFEKGLKRFPSNWKLAYAAAYHYLFEMQNPERAADLLLQANRYGGPSWLPVLASRLYTSSGKKALGKSVLEEYLRSNTDSDSVGVQRARERLEKLNSEPE